MPTLLFNGLGLSPAGQHVSISDLPLKMVIAPDRKAVVAVCAGFNNVGVNLVSLDAKHETQFIPLPETFNGLAFSPDGKRFYVTGGSQASSTSSNTPAAKPSSKRPCSPPRRRPRCFWPAWRSTPPPASSTSATRPTTKSGSCRPGTLKAERAIPVGQHPHTCVLGADGRHLYVSNWGSRSVSIVDTKSPRRVRDITVGLRPNDMALARDGRLFVACAGDNTVHVIATAKRGEAGPEAEPAAPLVRGHPRDHLAPRSTRSRRKAARPAQWPSRPMARRCSSPTPTRTT